jgi:hypothetical protein
MKNCIWHGEYNDTYCMACEDDEEPDRSTPAGQAYYLVNAAHTALHTLEVATCLHIEEQGDYETLCADLLSGILLSADHYGTSLEAILFQALASVRRVRAEVVGLQIPLTGSFGEPITIIKDIIGRANDY